ncbi:GNAT family N-acetyltransferase [Negadavirga shengliensis]|uniref:GNAT family N-acetyltransferase n=1 Tax=Negadavirga shengliensis TaxID=1389218 RepID=A0ABV9T2E9_9BACT
MENLKIFTGRLALDMCQDSNFISDWEALYLSCPWSTTFQHKAFVTNWYKYNQEEFKPVLIIKYESKALIGILPLAIPYANASSMHLRNNRLRIVGAGGYEAEYQTWLSPDTASGELFIREAIQLLFDHFPDHDMALRFIPSGAPINWVHTANWKHRSILQSIRRPLMEVKDPEFLKLPKKRGFKLKMNRLKRLGNITFKRVTDLNEFIAMVKELTIQFDFRQGAMFNKISYLDRPYKLAFLIALFKEDLLHTTVLLLNDEIISSVIANKTRNWIHLGGINTHTPFYAHHSPGFLHFILLGQQLVSDKMEVFDLTPGGDAYKERMATSSDTVHELLITNYKPYYFKRKLRKSFQELLIKNGKRPQSFDLEIRKKITALKKKIEKIKSTGLIGLINQAPQTYNLFSLAQVDNIIDSKTAIPKLKRNSLEDLLHYPNNLHRWEFLKTSMQKFENGESVITWTENKLLLASIWLTTPTADLLEKFANESLGEDDIVLHDFYLHPSAETNINDFIPALCQVVNKDIDKIKFIGAPEQLATFKTLQKKKKSLSTP